MNIKLSGRFLAVISFILLFAINSVAPTLAATLQQSQRSGAELSAKFLYLLSNFSGTVPSQWARLAFDPQRQEVYTLNQGVNDVRIYNVNGMELFAFGDTGDIVSGVDIAVGEGGNIYILARNFSRDAIQVLNYRGEPTSVVRIKEAPEQFSGFLPDRMEYRDGLFYLLDADALQVIITGADGTFKQGHDLSEKFNDIADEQDIEKKKSIALEISGFSVDSDVNIYLTAPTLFSAFRLNPDGTLDTFGTSGSGPGKFGVVSGIVADSKGNIYVADRLRSVVMIFDRNFVFQGEFGYRGGRPEDLIVPDDLLLDEAGQRVFVAQAANKGVGAYRVVLLQPP